MGTTFVVGFLENRIVNALPVGRLYLSSHSASAVTVDVSVPKIYMSSLYNHLLSDDPNERPFRDVTLTVQPDSVVVHEFPYEVHMLGTGIGGKGGSCVDRVRVYISSFRFSFSNLRTKTEKEFVFRFPYYTFEKTKKEFVFCS